MTLMADTELEYDVEQLKDWRLQTLLEVGWSVHAAEQIAARLDVDIELARQVKLRGCADDQLGLQIVL